MYALLKDLAHTTQISEINPYALILGTLLDAGLGGKFASRGGGTPTPQRFRSRTLYHVVTALDTLATHSELKLFISFLFS